MNEIRQTLFRESLKAEVYRYYKDKLEQWKAVDGLDITPLIHFEPDDRTGKHTGTATFIGFLAGRPPVAHFEWSPRLHGVEEHWRMAHDWVDDFGRA